MEIKLIMSLVLTFLLSLVIAPQIIKWLLKLKFGQSILEIGPSWHKNKQGTPTMGGIIFIIPILIVTLALGAENLFSGDFRLLYGILFAVFCGAIGIVDDYVKITKKHNQGLTAKQKTLLQVLAILLYVAAMALSGYISTDIFVPFFNIRLHLSYFYFPVIIAFIYFFVNSVNLTDGVDGLVTSVTLPYAVSFVFVALVFKEVSAGKSGMGILAAATVGGLLAFLIFNFHPAKVFMGDTGSLFLGGIVVCLAMSYDIPYFILLGGIVYLIEGLSVVLQVGYFKLTHGKRLFKMSPIHHHFEMCKWNEIKIVVVFGTVSLLACVCALWGVIYAASYYI